MKYQFGELILDLEAGRLLGRDGEVRLRPQAFRLLRVLVENAPKILSQEELLDRVWGVEHLSPASVKQAVSEVRQALGDDPARPAMIETIPRRGYRFIAPLAVLQEETQGPPVTPAPDFGTRPIVIPPEALDPLAPEPPPARETEPPPPPPAAARRWRPVLVLLVSLLAVLAGLSAFALRGRPSPSPAAAAARRSVAILGFKSLSGDPGDDWISGALAEIIGFELAAPGRVRLIPPENVERMRRELALTRAERYEGPTLARITRNLGTDLVVTGSYLRIPGKKETLRVQAAVQDVRTGETVAWARETGAPESLIELATAVARGLQGALGGGARTDPTALASNAEALQLYTRALALLRVWDAPAALPLLERAAVLDADNPFVQDALAAALSDLGFEARAREAARRAVDLSQGVPREMRLGIQGRFHALSDRWEEAAETYGELWRLHPDDLEHGLRLVSARKQIGQTREALATVEALRRLPSPAGDDPRIDLSEADVAWQSGDFARMRDISSRAIARGEERGAVSFAAAGHFTRGWALSRLGQSAGALADFQTARDHHLKVGARGAAMGALLGVASVLQETGRPAEARKVYDEALPVLREIGDRRSEAKALNNYAALLVGLGEVDRSISLLERSLDIKKEIADLQGAATTLNNLSNVLRIYGDLGQARRRAEEALEISRQLGDAHGTALALRGFARVLKREGRPAEALKALEEALVLSRGSGHAEGVAQTLVALAELEREARNLDRARERFNEALKEFERLEQTGDVAHARIAIAEIDFRQGRLDAARAGFGDALALAVKVKSGLYEAHARFGLAEVAARRGDLPGARSQHLRALALWEKMGDEASVERSREALAKLSPRAIVR
jgi:DNA-binding winged helix-turn-helix (wHTH) protein/tetratricopeptide (TPR) repeat protein/TolB-like protein